MELGAGVTCFEVPYGVYATYPLLVSPNILRKECTPVSWQVQNMEKDYWACSDPQNVGTYSNQPLISDHYLDIFLPGYEDWWHLATLLKR